MDFIRSHIHNSFVSVFSSLLILIYKMHFWRSEHHHTCFVFSCKNDTHTVDKKISRFSRMAIIEIPKIFHKCHLAALVLCYVFSFQNPHKNIQREDSYDIQCDTMFSVFTIHGGKRWYFYVGGNSTPRECCKGNHHVKFTYSWMRWQPMLIMSQNYDITTFRSEFSPNFKLSPDIIC